MPDQLLDVSDLPNVRDAMTDHGYDEILIKKMCHENWLRLLEKTWGS